MERNPPEESSISRTTGRRLGLGNAEKTQTPPGRPRSSQEANPSARPKPEEETTPSGTPTERDALKTAIDAEWRMLDKAFEAKRTQGRSNATREEKIDPGIQPKPEEATTLP